MPPAGTIRLTTLHHVSVSVTDLPRARHFYATVLGLDELPRPAFDFEGAWFALGDRQLHLIVHPSARTLRGTTTIDAGDGHFALRVESIAEALEALRRHGIVVRERIENATPWAQLFVTDPDGNVIELNADREPAGHAVTREAGRRA
jgi:catechol 2,3-dioxygenase-like lactoylglutathione lyase family enzyme